MKIIFAIDGVDEKFNQLLTLVSEENTGSLIVLAGKMGISISSVKNYLEDSKILLEVHHIYIRFDRMRNTYYFSVPCTFQMEHVKVLHRLAPIA